MKKLFLISILSTLFFSCLFCEEVKFKTGGSTIYDYKLMTTDDLVFRKTDNSEVCVITAVIPYNDGFIIELDERKSRIIYRYFVNENYPAFIREYDKTSSGYKYRDCYIKSIKPNEFVIATGLSPLATQQ
mgnify:CR=1 FL=1